MFSEIISFLPEMESGEFAEWIVSRGHAGTMDDPMPMPFVYYCNMIKEFEEAVYKVVDEHPELGLGQYGTILEENGIEWGVKSMNEADVSKLDARGVMALIVGAIRADRFCEGALLGFLEEGKIQEWLERLQEVES